MTVKEELIQKVATDLELPEDLVFSIIAFQGEDALQAVKTVHELEFSGFGKFLLSQTKVNKKIDICQQALVKYAEDPERVEGLRKAIEEYKLKLR